MSKSPDDTTNNNITINISKFGKTHPIILPSTALLADLILASEDALLQATPAAVYDWDKAKFIAAGALLRAGQDDHKPIAHLHNKKVPLQVPTVQDIESIRHSSDAAKARDARRAAQRRAAVQPARTTRRRPGENEYGFAKIEPLPGLRNPERSREFLEKLADDVGIRATMRKHGFTVGLLTEMDPLSNTSSTHEGTTRLLGLNRNRGQVIELRLRTDAYDGYRAYNTIRATLCHELAHNVHGPHDRQFWDLCHQIEREVAAASSGRSVGDGGGWEPSGAGEEDEDVDVPDHGGWTGGTFVLGGGGGGNGSGSGCSSGSGSGSGAGGSVSDAAAAGLSRRDVIAKAAEERMKRAREGGSAPPDDGATGGGGTT